MLSFELLTTVASPTTALTIEEINKVRIKTFTNNSEVILAVSDDGNGIEQYMLEKLGNPFFTTKEHGTGLGLAVCYGIVSRHNGRISIETSPTGSTFNVHFELSN